MHLGVARAERSVASRKVEAAAWHLAGQTPGRPQDGVDFLLTLPLFPLAMADNPPTRFPVERGDLLRQRRLILARQPDLAERCRSFPPSGLAFPRSAGQHGEQLQLVLVGNSD